MGNPAVFAPSHLQEYITVGKEVEYLNKLVEVTSKDPKQRVPVSYLTGPPGIGKTLLCQNVAKKFAMPFVTVNCVSSMIDLDLLGMHLLKGKDMIWQDGPIPAAIRAANQYGRAMLILNEINALTPNTQLAFNPLMDHQSGVVLTLNDNENVKVEEGNHLFIMCSMNKDVRGINILQEAFLDRAGPVFDLEYPDEKTESKIISLITGIDKNKARKFVDVGIECRNLCMVDKTVTVPVSPRGIIEWVRQSQIFGPKVGFELAIANKYAGSKNEKRILNGIAKGSDVAAFEL